MNRTDHTIRVLTVRSANPFGFGGCIFSGRAVNERGDVIDATALYVVKARSEVIGDIPVHKGQCWRVSGDPVVQTRIVDRYKIQEWQIDALDASLVRPSGDHIINYLADSEEFEGIGLVKARKLWNAYGESLYRFLDDGDVEALEAVLSRRTAEHLVKAWARHGDSGTLQWLHKNGFNTVLGRKVIAFFGRDTPSKIEEDPYRLLSFCSGWKEVDQLAQSYFNVKDSDPRRLLGAVEESLYRLFDHGHTAGDMRLLEVHLETVLGRQKKSLEWRSLINDAIDSGLCNGSYIIATDDMIHPLGPMVMEMTVAEAIRARIGEGRKLKLLADHQVTNIIDRYESTLPFPLTAEQRLAVKIANDNLVAIIVGGAGVGKTTVLQTIYQIYDATDTRIFQVALAGRAAMRMNEATGRAASTIASFLRTIRAEDLSGPAVVVVDEASMVDIITMSRLCETVPLHVRLLLVGDSSQLMPVGPGLVLHALVKVDSVPKVELTQVQRYGGDIAKAAAEIRAGEWPMLRREPEADICFIPCSQKEIADLIVQMYDRDPENTKILTMRKRSFDGTTRLNELCQARYTAGGTQLTVWSDLHQMEIGAGFYLNDIVMCTRNRWDLGIQNGSLGRLVEINKLRGAAMSDAVGEIGKSVATIEWDDGIRRPVFEELLDDLTLGYAITVHKAQGSQWPVVIVSLTQNRLLDRTSIYTAVTRARSKVIIVGDPDAASMAVKATPKAQRRKTGLQRMLQGTFEVI